MMRIILISISAAILSGCAVYTTPYPYPAPVIYGGDPWPVRVPVYQPQIIYSAPAPAQPVQPQVRQ